MDEPTAVLTPQEVDELFKILKALKKQGKTIIFITHKLNEVMAVSDRVTIMRNGKVVGTKETKQTSTSEIATLMVGREVLLTIDKTEQQTGKIVLRLEKVNSLNQQRYAVLKDVTLSIKEGQILGIAGVEGNGQAELVEVINGLRPITSGNIFLYEQDITGFSPRKIRELNIGHIPEDKAKRGYIADYSVAENLVLGSHYKPFCHSLFINFPEVNKLADRLINDYDIRPASKDNLLKSLSGETNKKLL